eukprot:14587565-Ditylum_brightwellii.AAC.1
MDIYKDADLGGILLNTIMKTDEPSTYDTIVQPIVHYNRSNHHQQHNRNNRNSQKEGVAHNFQQQTKYCQAYQNCKQNQSNLNRGCHACLLDPEGSMIIILCNHEDNCPF